eukprot:8191448-Alexandrium_andersonii.AAC.1
MDAWTAAKATVKFSTEPERRWTPPSQPNHTWNDNDGMWGGAPREAITSRIHSSRDRVGTAATGSKRR